MFPVNSNGMVRIWYTRSLDTKRLKLGGINDLSLTIDDSLQIRSEEYFAFIDGPRHDKEGDTLNGFYDYFCTSGGIPWPKQEQLDFRIWILDGWTEDEAVAGLQALGYNGEMAKEAYDLCGGSIRNHAPSVQT